jgi:hypothetical protein
VNEKVLSISSKMKKSIKPSFSEEGFKPPL